MNKNIMMTFSFLVLIGMCMAAQAESPSALLEKGIYTEETVGNLDAAIVLYQKVITSAEPVRETVAQAYFRLGKCYLKKGENKKALEAFQTLVREYPNEKTLAPQAQKYLSEARLKATRNEVPKIVNEAVMTISTCGEGDPRVKKALDTLPGLDESLVVKELASFLDSDMPTVRRSAIYILWRGDFKNITPAVTKLLKLCGHQEEFTRGMAAITLGANKIVTSYDLLAQMTAKDSSGYARRCGAYALGMLGLAKAKPILEKAMEDKDSLVQANAAAALKILSAGPETIKPLEQGEFPEFVGCRFKAAITLKIEKPDHQVTAPPKKEIYAADLPDFRWTVAPEIEKKANVFVVTVSSVKPQGMKPLTRTASKNQPVEYQPLPEGEFQVTVSAYEKDGDQANPKNAIGSGTAMLTVNPTPYSQMGVSDIQPDGKILFSQIIQERNSSSETIKTMGFINSDFVHQEKMFDIHDKPMEVDITHKGSHFRYHVTLNEPVPPGGFGVYRTEGYVMRLIQQIPDTPNEFQYVMVHSPNAGQVTRRIEVYKLPKGATLISTTPSNMLRRERDGRIELCNQKMIPAGGTITTIFRYRLGQGKPSSTR